MKKFKIIVILIVLLILVLSFFVVEDHFYNEKFTLILNIINTTQILATFLVAYLVYDRFGTSRKLLDKQNDIVIEYIEHIKNIKLHIYEWTGENVYTKREIGVTRSLEWLYQEKDKPVLFKSDYYSSKNIKKLFKLVNHPLFPTEIKSKVNIFSFQVMTTTFNDFRQGYAFITFNEEESKFIMTEWMLAGDSHADCLTLNQLLKQVENLLETLEKWVNEESSIKINLNF